MSFFNSNYSGKGITNSQVVTEEGKYALDAAQNNPDIEGSLRNSINNISDKIDSRVVNAWNNFLNVSQTGYIHLARIKILSAYIDFPLRFTINGRGFKKPANLIVLFKISDGTDPDINQYTHDAEFISSYDYKFYITKETAGTWNIYASRTAYRTIAVTGAEIFRAENKKYFDVTYPNILLDVLPDGSLEFTQET